MDENAIEKIREIKGKVTAMLEERRRHGNGEMAILSPSEYWADFCSFFDYMLGLPDECFAKLRLHTYHLTADNYQTYYFGNAEQFRAAVGLDELTEGIPSEYVLNEPEGGIGFHYEHGRFVSLDIIRFQKVVNSLYRHGVFTDLISTGRERRNVVLDIGGGYGGLAHHFSKILGELTYVIVDLPETLLFSGSYLSLLNPKKSLYLYDSGDFTKLINSNHVNSYDFILVPDYQLHKLRNLRFDLALNVASFQEMRTGQVKTYLDFLLETCTGILYSCNQDCQPSNHELTNLSRLLAERFELREMPNVTKLSKRSMRTSLKRGVRSIASLVGLAEGLPPTAAVPRELLCKPLREVNPIGRGIFS